MGIIAELFCFVWFLSAVCKLGLLADVVAELKGHDKSLICFSKWWQTSQLTPTPLKKKKKHYPHPKNKQSSQCLSGAEPPSYGLRFPSPPPSVLNGSVVLLSQAYLSPGFALLPRRGSGTIKNSSKVITPRFICPLKSRRLNISSNYSSQD